MEFTVNMSFNGSQEVALANNYPNIRVFTVGQGNTSLTPYAELASIEQTWATASQASIGGAGLWTYFSGVCWFYAKNLYGISTYCGIGDQSFFCCHNYSCGYRRNFDLQYNHIIQL
jgi:hypothetical protein